MRNLDQVTMENGQWTVLQRFAALMSVKYAWLNKAKNKFAPSLFCSFCSIKDLHRYGPRSQICDKLAHAHWAFRPISRKKTALGVPL